MKRLEIVLEHDQLDAVRGLLDQHATGYTVIPQVTGCGHHGSHEGDIALLLTVTTKDHVDPILDAVLPLLRERSGMVVVSDVSVVRGEYFVPEIRPGAVR